MSATSSREIHRLLDEAPFVGALALALAGHDADEVIQGTWLQAMESDASAVRHPRKWLACVVRGVAHNLRRGRARRHAHERAAAHRDLVLSSTELMEREERRRELVQAVDALPEPLRTVVLLRYFEDMPPRTIAERLGLPVTTVWNRLRTALATLRQRLDDRHGDRRAWLLPLLPAQAATAALATGILAMTIKTKVVAAVGVLALAVLALWTFDGLPGAPPPGPGGPGQPPPLTAEAPRDQEAPDAKVERTEVVRPAPAAEPTTGTLIVKATYSEDGPPVPDLVVMVGPPGADRVDNRRGRTDDLGIARFEGLPPGRIWVQNVRNGDELLRTEVVAGVETEAELVLPTGIAVTGIVVDRDAVPVPGAEVYLAPPSRADRDIEHVADAGADGRFALRSCPRRCLIAARADGHSPSRLQLVFLQEGTTKELRIELPGPGGTVTGVVMGPDGSPVRDAVVRIGAGRTIGLSAGSNGEAGLPALVRTDADGRFRAVGVAVGEHPVGVRALGLAPWQGTCRVDAHLTSGLEILLEHGMSCTGMVVGADDAPLAKVEIEVGSWLNLAHYYTLTGADGMFRLDGLPPGEVEIRAEHERGKAAARLQGGPGETLSCRLRLDRGLELRGRVLTADDAPVRAFLDVYANRTQNEKSWRANAVSDADGRFAITNCPDGRTLRITARGRGVRDKRIDDVDPRAGELVIRLDTASLASARIVGKVVAPDGTPAAHAEVSGSERKGGRSGLEAASETGAFELGPLVPGTWRVSIRAEGHPPFSTEWCEIAADAELDLGTIWLAAGGTVRVRIFGVDGLVPRLSLRDASSHWHPFSGEGDELRSGPVAPGDCHVSVHGRGVASQLAPVEVRAGEETEVEVQIEAGYRQRFQFVAPTPLSERRMRILRGDEVVVDSIYRARTDWVIPYEWERWLAPGDYTVTATGNGLSGQARVTVREGTDGVVRVLLR